MNAFNLNEYEPVDARLRKFWRDHSNGRIATQLVQSTDNSYIVRAQLYRHIRDDQPAATGHAQETVGVGEVNIVSALENCETSALGRALANLGYATKGKRASREEMSKAAGRKIPTDSPDRDTNPRASSRSGADTTALVQQIADAQSHDDLDAVTAAIALAGLDNHASHRVLEKLAIRRAQIGAMQ